MLSAFVSVVEWLPLPSSIPSILMTPDRFVDFLDDIDTFIFDADGVLWLADKVIPGSPRLIEFLINNNKKVIVLTNNATKSREIYAQKLQKLGYNPQLNKKTLVNPAAVIADLLDREGFAKSKKKVYLIGPQGVRDEMDAKGISYFGHGPEPQDDRDGSAFIFDVDLKEKPCDVGAVVVAYENHFNYHKLMKAANYLQDENCLFLCTNEDETCPGPNPKVITPDVDLGPIVSSVRIASGRNCKTVGKPFTPAFQYITRRWNIDVERTLMVGDRTNTDVKFGRDHGLRTMLVLSGIHQVKDIMMNYKEGRKDMVPDYYAPCLGALLKDESVKSDETRNN